MTKQVLKEIACLIGYVVIVALISGIIAESSHADNDVTNSNNTNTSTQTNEINHQDTYDSHDQINDSSTSTDNSTDNSAYSHNTEGSYNQANKSWQTITNTNTEGDLNQSKNTNSFNQNSGNSNGSNVVQSATGGAADSVSSSASNSSVNGVSSGAAAVGSNVVKTGAVTTTFNQVRQHRVVPFAFAPGLAMSFSQDNCANSASIGVSTGIFGASGGMPINNDACNRRKDVQMWLAVQQPRIACERMIQGEENLAAMRKAGLTCEQLTTAAPVAIIPSVLNVPPNSYWDKLDKVADAQISRIHLNGMMK